MGLGLLFVGYFTLTIAALPLPGIATFAGYLLAGYAATKLMAYQSWFRYMRLISFIGAILSFPALTTKICGYLGMEIGFLAFADTYLYLLAVDLTLLAFHAAMYLAICKLATETGVEKIRVSSARNLVFFGFVYMAKTAFGVIGNFGDSFKTLASVGTAVCTLIYIVILVLTHVMLFSAYMWICDENDVDMEIKDTGIGWLDKIRRSAAEKEQKAADDTKDYLQRRYDEKHKSSNTSQKRKKKKKK